MTKELWRSKFVHWHKGGWKLNILLGLSFSLVFILPSLYYLFGTFPLYEIDRDFSIIAILIGAILVFLTFLSTLKYFTTYIVIYRKGILLRKPYTLVHLKKKFIPFEEIEDADYVKVEKVRSRFWGLAIYLILPKKDRTNKFIKLRIFFKDRKPYIIDSKWVSNYRKCISLILKHKKP